MARSPRTSSAIVSTSVSGVPETVWQAFQRSADRHGLSDREALDRAIADLALAMDSGDVVEWQSVRRVARRPVRMLSGSQGLLNDLSRQTGYRLNAVLLTAVVRWLKTERLGEAKRDDPAEGGKP